MATTNKQQALSHLLTILKKQYDPAEPESKPVFEQLMYAILREGATREQADAAYKALVDGFYDWNEIRVSEAGEIEEALGDLPGAGPKSQRLLSVLQDLFEKYFSFKLDEIDKKGLKHAAKKLAEIPDATDFVVGWVVQQALGGHAIPLDQPGLRVLKRLGVIDTDADATESIRSTIEHYVPKAKGALFNEVVSLLARDYCWEEDPHCTSCPMLKECPTGQMRKSESEPRSPRNKPR